VEYALSMFSAKKEKCKEIYLEYVMENEKVEKTNWQKIVDEEILI